MRNSITLLTFLIVIPTLLNAQTNFKLGVRAGMSYVNNILVEDNWKRLDENQYRIGYHVGVIGKMKITEKLSTSTEILYSNQGYHFEGYQTSDPPGDGNVHYNYISIPMFAEYQPLSRLTIQAGPQLAYLLSAKTKFKSETVNLFDFWEELGIESSLNRFDFGIGLGSEFLISENTLIGFRYFHGLSSFFENQQSLTDDQGNPVKSPNHKNQNRTFQLSIAYLIW